MYAHRLIKAGIELLPQCPLEQGVNIWNEDILRSIETLKELDRLLTIAVGTRPYKWILDMQGEVSLLTGIKVWKELHDRHQGESDITRPTSFAVFSPQPAGNLNISWHTLWAMEMSVDKEKGVVIYRIPHPGGVWIEYTERIWEGINDNSKILEELKKV